jgi:hypothetical protein
MQKIWLNNQIVFQVSPYGWMMGQMESKHLPIGFMFDWVIHVVMAQ